MVGLKRGICVETFQKLETVSQVDLELLILATFFRKKVAVERGKGEGVEKRFLLMANIVCTTLPYYFITIIQYFV